MLPPATTACYHMPTPDTTACYHLPPPASAACYYLPPPLPLLQPPATTCNRCLLPHTTSLTTTCYRWLILPAATTCHHLLPLLATTYCRCSPPPPTTTTCHHICHYLRPPVTTTCYHLLPPPATTTYHHLPSSATTSNRKWPVRKAYHRKTFCRLLFLSFALRSFVMNFSRKISFILLITQ